MAEEAQYGSDSVATKRKYEDEAPPPPPPSSAPRRVTGFSAPISSHSPDAGDAPASYNNVPPPSTDAFEIAKQKAQAIAARLCSTAVDAKRPKVENGGSGYDSSDNVMPKPLVSPAAHSTQAAYGNSYQSSYGGQTNKKIEIPNGRVGVIIGKGGETIKYLQQQSGSKIQVTRDTDAPPYSQTREVELMGTEDQIRVAEKLIQDVLAEAESGGSGIVSRRVTGPQPGGEQYVTKIPNNKVGLVIGKGGETIKTMQSQSGARIQVIPLHLAPGDPATERTLQIDGTSEQIDIAKSLVNEVISENRPRNSSMGGGYSQQGYQARPPTSWAPPPMQQTGYGYAQPGAYTAPSQYMSQPQYPGYPPQPASGGYATGWDQTTGAPTQQAAQGGAYDYYGQQQQQQAPGATSAAPADSTNYGYAQPAAGSYNQGYAQDGSYAGYQAPGGYGQPQPNSGYDQQQGYAAGYGSVAAPTTEGQTASYGAAQGDTTAQAPPSGQSSAVAQQGYATTQNPSANPAGYPSQGTTQPGYGAPAAQPGYGTQPPAAAAASGYGPNYGQPQAPKPPANQSPYGQPQQSPSAQGGYAQPGYAPHSQAPPAQGSYAQPDTGAPRAPAAGGYGGAATAQQGYGAPQYGAQPGYGQQPPPYNSGYGGAYSQPPTYAAADGSTGAAPASQAKASPPS